MRPIFRILAGFFLPVLQHKPLLKRPGTNYFLRPSGMDTSLRKVIIITLLFFVIIKYWFDCRNKVCAIHDLFIIAHNKCLFFFLKKINQSITYKCYPGTESR